MSNALADADLRSLQAALADLDPDAPAVDALASLAERGLDQLPLPGSGATWQRWRALATVAAFDLSLAKLYEGHTDALAIMAELGVGEVPHGSTWGTWAAEAPNRRAIVERLANGRLAVRGGKAWCSGAAGLSHGLLTAWFADGRGPQLVRVAMAQPGVAVDAAAWRAVGMAGSASIDVRFSDAVNDVMGDVVGDEVGGVGDYLSRPGFWQGGAGVAACWYGGATALGAAVHRAVLRAPAAQRSPFRLAALGKIDVALQATAALLRDAAVWIDAYPQADASAIALRARLAAEDCARLVLDEAGRTLGAAAFCLDAHFARVAADLPVFVRQSHAERDFAALGERVAQQENDPWLL